MNILMPAEMLKATARAFSGGEIYYRNGIALEKGATISEKRIKRNLKLYQQYMDLFCSYPDCYLRLILPRHSKFKLKFFQIIFIRACLRFGRVLTVAPRAAGKSFICILALYLICMFRPGSHVNKRRYRIARCGRKDWLKAGKSKLLILPQYEKSFV